MSIAAPLLTGSRVDHAMTPRDDTLGDLRSPDRTMVACMCKAHAGRRMETTLMGGRSEDLLCVFFYSKGTVSPGGGAVA